MQAARCSRDRHPPGARAARQQYAVDALPVPGVSAVQSGSPAARPGAQPDRHGRGAAQSPAAAPAPPGVPGADGLGVQGLFPLFPLLIPELGAPGAVPAPRVTHQNAHWNAHPNAIAQVQALPVRERHASR